MKRVLTHIEARGFSVLKVFCASDPSSLDGLIISDLKIAFMDGTSPHVVEPKLPGVCETLLDFGVFWDSDKLYTKRQEIIAAVKENSLCHKRAAELIGNAGRLFSSFEYSPNVGNGLIERHICDNGKKGRIIKAFLGGITPDGVKYFDETVKVEKTIIVGGKNADSILKNAYNTALHKEFSTIVFDNPILPSLTDGVLIPELSLFVVRDKFIPDNDGVLDNLALASKEISKAKAIHDELEDYYISAMDFDKLNVFTEEFLEKI